MNDSESSSAIESLPHVLADIGDTIDLDDGVLWQRVTQRRRTRRRRRNAVGGLGAAVIVAAVATTAIAFADRTGPSLRVGTSASQVSTSTTLAPLALQDLALGANCTRPHQLAPLPAGLSLEFVPSSTTVTAGASIPGQVTLSNSGSTPLQVETDWPETFAASDNTVVGGSATPPGPVLLIAHILQIPPHGHASTPVTVAMLRCPSNVPSAAPAALQPGRYDVYVALTSGPGSGSSDPGSVFATPPVTVTVEAAGRIYGTMTTPQRVVVPDLIGMNRTSLTDTLRPLGLTAVSSTATSTTVPKGDVIAQDPEAGMHVRVGTVVHVVISRGP